MKWAVLLFILSPLAGCSTPSQDAGIEEGGETAVPADPFPEETAKLPADSRGAISGLRVFAGPGSVSVDGLLPGATGNLSSGDRVITEFAADANGRLELAWLEPNQTYRIHTLNAWAEFRTSSLPWEWNRNDSLIQPGKTLVSGCTLGLILRDARHETLYGLTAGHCFDAEGEQAVVEGEEHVVVGEVTALETFGDAGRGSVDFAVFEIDAEFYNHTQPQIYEVGGPIRVGLASELEKGDELCWFGHGTRYGFVGIGPTKSSARCGEYDHTEGAGTGNETLWASGHAYIGDSGAAVVGADGAWYGLLMQGIQFDDYEAVTACNTLHAIHRHGLDLWPVMAPLRDEEIGIYPPGPGIGSTAMGTVFGRDISICSMTSPLR